MIEEEEGARQGQPAESAAAAAARARELSRGLLLAWLGVALPLLAAGVAARPEAWPFLPAHLLVLAGLVALRGGRRRTRMKAVLGAWAVLVLFPFLYAELPVLMLGFPGPLRYHDPVIQALESALFAGQPSLDWSAALPLPALSELQHLGYLLYYPLIYVPPLLLWVGATGPRSRGVRERAFHETVLALAVAMLACFAVMVAWPVQGPRYLGVPEAVPPGPFRSLALAVLEAGSSRGAAFPSSHVSVAVAQAALALRWQPRTGVVVAVVALLLAPGAVYGGFHYLVDVGVGAAVGAAAAGIALRAGSTGAGRNPA